MTRTSKYLNQDTIVALQAFQIEKIDREITDYLDTNNKMNTYHFNFGVVLMEDKLEPMNMGKYLYIRLMMGR